MSAVKSVYNSNGGVAMDGKKTGSQWHREFFAGFLAGLTVLGGIALILLTIFWL